MLELPDVTLCCIDTRNHALAMRALARSRDGVRFARALLLTDALPADTAAPEGIDVVSGVDIASREAYSEFVLKSLLPHITTTHVLLVQWDGYVVNPAAWDSTFLACDYIGAKWFWNEDGMRVGNGGFSLRSRRLLEALQDSRIVLADAEDTTIGRTFRPLLEREHGIRFADEALADRFSFEAAYPIGRPFGFHGLFNFCRTVAPDEIAALAPQFSDAIARSLQLLQLMRNCSALGQWNAVIAIATRILAAVPDHTEAATLLATCMRQAQAPPAVGRNDPCPCGSGKRYKKCHGALRATGAAAAATMPARPPDADALVRSALAAHQRGELERAESGYRSALGVAAEHPLALHYLGVILYQRHRLDEAMPLLERAAAAIPAEPEFQNNLGLALAAADRNDEAIAAYRRALALKPDHAVASNNLGLALQASNRLPEAIAAYREALLAAPDFAQAHWNLSLALLAHGEFAEGWREYEWRLSIAELGQHARTYASPRWDGNARPGLTLLVYTEQGLGDALQFSRFATLLAQRGIRVVVVAPSPLVPLLASVPGVASAVGPDDPVPRHDAHIPLLSVPGMLGISHRDIPSSGPYITAERTRRAQAAAALEPYRGRLKVGLAWAGNRAHANDRRRSIALAALTPLLDLPGTAWFSLQPMPDDAATASVAGASALVRLPIRSELAGTAALIAELDLMVTVDTSIAHLAGALAKPTWILLPFAPDWRWHLDRADSPWYPTMRLFRQPAPGDWVILIAQVQAELQTTLQQHGIRSDRAP
jgi:tetratricopeptide (TPR) repeat protein